MVEDAVVADVPDLADPVDALHAISRDLSCRRPVALAGRGTETPIGIQRRYLDRAHAYVEGGRAPTWVREIVPLWQRVLDQLEQDPEGLVGAVGAATSSATGWTG